MRQKTSTAVLSFTELAKEAVELKAPFAAKRLRKAATLDSVTTSELIQIVAPEAIHQEIELGKFAAAGGIFINNVRNPLAIIPICFTWISIGLAVYGYHQIDPKSDNAQRPFIYLWQQGLPGDPFSFSFTATVTASFLALYIILLIVVQTLEGRARIAADHFIIKVSDAIALSKNSGSQVNRQPPGDVDSAYIGRVVREAIEAANATYTARLEDIRGAFSEALQSGMQEARQVFIDAVGAFQDTQAAERKANVEEIHEKISVFQRIVNDFQVFTAQIRDDLPSITSGLTTIAPKIDVLANTATQLKENAQLYGEIGQMIVTGATALTTAHNDVSAKLSSLATGLSETGSATQAAAVAAAAAATSLDISLVAIATTQQAMVQTAERLRAELELGRETMGNIVIQSKALQKISKKDKGDKKGFLGLFGHK